MIEVSNKQEIGTYFKKDSIFLATIFCNVSDTKEIIKSRLNVKFPDEILDIFVEARGVTVEQYDIFYKDDKGYTRFVEEGPETFAGDNSDGKGIIKNIVPIWDYYSEDQVFEATINDEFVAICTNTEGLNPDPLERYNQDYNKR